MLSITAARQLRDMTVAVDLTLDAGVTTLVGPSGAGKSTLLRMVMGLARPDQGTIRLGAELLDDAARGYHLAPGRRRVGVVFQEYALFPHLSVAENVAFGLRAHNVPRDERRRRVEAMLERLGLRDLARARTGQISGGQRQRVALARALVLDPLALLLDEPLSALDVQTRAAVRRELRAILPDLPIPTVLVTHDVADALVFRERIVIMDEGRVVRDGPYSALLAHPGSRFVADFIGVNYFEGTLERRPGALDGDARVRLDGGVDVEVAAAGVPPGPVGLSVAPWQVALSPEAPAASSRNVVRARVREVLPLGGYVRVVLAAGPDEGLPVIAELGAGDYERLRYQVGQSLYALFQEITVGGRGGAPPWKDAGLPADDGPRGHAATGGA